jgi:hypothetical protein
MALSHNPQLIFLLILHTCLSLEFIDHGGAARHGAMGFPLQSQ